MAFTLQLFSSKNRSFSFSIFLVTIRKEIFVHPKETKKGSVSVCWDLPENPVDMEDRIVEIVVTLCTLWCLYKIMMCFYLKDSLCIDPKIRHKTVFEML